LVQFLKLYYTCLSASYDLQDSVFIFEGQPASVLHAVGLSRCGSALCVAHDEHQSIQLDQSRG